MRRYPLTPRISAFSRYKKNPCQLRAQIAFTSHTTALIASTQPSARMEKVVAACALPTHRTPRITSRMPNTKNQPQDFLTCSRPATKKSETVVIVFLLSHTAGSAARLNRSSAQEHLGSVLGNGKRRSRLRIGVKFPEDRRTLLEVLL